jgi:RNA polymerase sigma-70 factor (ECF subfamily)
MTGNCHDTEDLTQETFLRALKRLDSFAPGTQMRAWLLRIATNAFFDVKRRSRRVISLERPDSIPAAGVGPEHRLEKEEQNELLRRALDELSSTTRLVFHLRTYEGLSFREIGSMAGISEESARWHMLQARAKLTARLADKM